MIILVYRTFDVFFRCSLHSLMRKLFRSGKKQQTKISKSLILEYKHYVQSMAFRWCVLLLMRRLYHPSIQVLLNKLFDLNHINLNDYSFFFNSKFSHLLSIDLCLFFAFISATESPIFSINCYSIFYLY